VYADLRTFVLKRVDNEEVNNEELRDPPSGVMDEFCLETVLFGSGLSLSMVQVPSGVPGAEAWPVQVLDRPVFDVACACRCDGGPWVRIILLCVRGTGWAFCSS